MIECYYSQCAFHSCHYDDIGPLCEEQDCRAESLDLVKWAEQRKQEKLEWEAQYKRLQEDSK